ncbi:MAG: hypothetical protein WA584_02270 [Pyrinomonadaceae bacterium]
MNRKPESIPVVLPPALDAEETELAARNEFLAKNEMLAGDFDDSEIAGEERDEIVLDEMLNTPGGESDEVESKTERRAKRRKSLVFLTVFGAVFVIFVGFISWAFGFGFFAPAKSVAVDRSQKTNGSESATTNSDEKLKTALALVANENGSEQNSPVLSDASTDPNAVAQQDLSLTPSDKVNEQPNNQSSGNMIVLPNENGTQNQVSNNQPIPQGSVNLTPNLISQNVSDTNTGFRPQENNNNGGNLAAKTDGAATARSVFFGSLTKRNDSVSENNSQTNVSVRNSVFSNESANVPAFGTLLPVRLLGAVYTLRESGGLVRMEISRAIQKNGFSYPAGTVLVGRLRGSEYNRAFISVFGAIDPKTGKLVKFEGDVMGTDGASGVSGSRKSVKSWGTRFLNALRETGGQVVNVLASRGGRGGTIVLGGTTGISGEVSSVLSGNSQTDSFVVVKAGTEAYVLITDLPDEQRDDNANFSGNNNQIPGFNLSESEMAEILTTDDANKLRAAFMKMSPQFRALAIRAMEENK